MVTRTIPQDELFAYLDLLLASGVIQMSMVFDWKIGQWQVSYPEKQDNDAQLGGTRHGDDDSE